jgi:hypothetical protein
MMNANIDQTLSALNTALKDLIDQAHTPVPQEITQYLEFRAKSGQSNVGKGLIWSGEGTTKQIIFNHKPDRFFVTEHVELGKDKSLLISGQKVIDSTSLGSGIVSSQLREVGNLKGLVVDGSARIAQSFHFDAKTKRLGLGTNDPKSSIGIVENGCEVSFGVNEDNKGILGTNSMADLDLMTNGSTRLSIKSNGNIDFGNANRPPVQVKVHGKVSVSVENPDPNVDLHVAGAVRLNNRLQMVSAAPPTRGTYNVGDMVWNETPKLGSCIGWVCLRPGSPGSWYPFGEIKDH